MFRRLWGGTSLVSIARIFALTLITLALSCGGAGPQVRDPLDEARRAAEGSTDGEVVGRLLLAELFAPGGEAARAKAARTKLDGLGEAAQKGLFAALGRGVDDEGHGRFRSAARAYLDVLTAARTSDHPDAPLAGWYASHHLLRLRGGVTGLWSEAKATVSPLLDKPGNIGWRARGELVEWWTIDGAPEEVAAEGAKDAAPPPPSRDDASTDKDKTEPPSALVERASKRYGCAMNARMAGPFGHLAASDQRVRWDAERAGSWPSIFPKDPLRSERPRARPVDRSGCSLKVRGAPPGIYYVETFLDLGSERELIVSVQGALAVFVDDTEVLTRDTRQWGIWPRFGARIRLSAGRHRVLARVLNGETSIRLVATDGTPLGEGTSSDPAPPYTLTPPVLLPDPNVLDPFLVALGVAPQAGAPRPPDRDTSDPISLALAAYLAHVEGQDDVGSVLIEPLVLNRERATGPALALAAVFLDKDPIFPQGEARDRMKELRAAASQKDDGLWWPSLWLALDEADKAGIVEVAPKIVALADKFREVPDILKGLAAIYGRMHWKVEQRAAVRLAAERFPDDVEALEMRLKLHEEEGEGAEADKLAARIKKLDPETEIDIERALRKHDYKAAIAELDRLGTLRKDRRDIAARINDLRVRAGDSSEPLAKLEAAAQKNPIDGHARLALADARLARGDKKALERALVDALSSGADASALREAIELVDGITEVSPYRVDGRRVITEYESKKREMPGTAARVLDYSALWVRPDGSARMLEHEIIRIQSREGIAEQAEQRPRGLLLKIRTIKKDGRTFEPEVVEGKPTVTMPHLEIGDYVETETVMSLRGDGQGGILFEGPRWFFREEKIPYFRSEFIVISPKNRPLDIETGGVVPAPEVIENGALVTRRWRVDQSPALPEEPASAPIAEFLPNVRVGWGIRLTTLLTRMVDAASNETVRDPRLMRVAKAIVDAAPMPSLITPPKRNKAPQKPGAPADAKPDAGEAPQAKDKDEDKPAAPTDSIDERARRIYRWVLGNVEPGRESDGRRVLIGRSGNRTEAFLYLCRLAGIEVELGMVHDRLTAPARGPMSEAETFNTLAVRVTTEKGKRWMVVRDKFEPYGYLPSSLRGQPVVLLRAGAPQEKTSTEGSPDGVTHEGVVTLDADGSATLDLDQRYEGKFAVALRAGLERLPESQIKEAIEARLLPQTFPGARLLSIEVKNLSDIDAPLILRLKAEMSSMARPQGNDLVLSPPFPIHLGGLAALPSRETPIYIAEPMAARATVKLTIKLPKGASVTSPLDAVSLDDGGRSVRVRDHMEDGVLMLDRSLDVPAGRIQPPEYAAFQAFTRKVDASIHRDIVISLGQR